MNRGAGVVLGGVLTTVLCVACAYRTTSEPTYWGAYWRTPLGCTAGNRDCELEEEFRVFVASRQHCRKTDDCTLAVALCPLPESVPVNVRYRGEVENRADQIQRLGKEICFYDVAHFAEVACVTGRCESRPR